jgi:F420-0:gamma-glutamyl ligase
MKGIRRPGIHSSIIADEDRDDLVDRVVFILGKAVVSDLENRIEKLDQAEENPIWLR